MEVSNKQIWDSEDFTFQPLVTELLSIKVIKQMISLQDFDGVVKSVFPSNHMIEQKNINTTVNLAAGFVLQQGLDIC